MSWFFTIFAMIGIVTFVPSLIVGIVLFVMAYADKQDIKRKARLKKQGWLFVLVSFGMILFSLLGNVAIGVLTY